MKKSAILILISIFVLSGCAQNEAGEEKVNYEETKKMVVDILKTDDGKKAIEEVMSDEKMKSKFILDQTVVSESIEKTIISEKGKKFWKKTFEDPKFASAYAKSMEDEHKKLLKDLMKDPTYRKLLAEIFQDPEMEKEIISIIKSNKVRDEMKKTLLETMDSPLVKVKMQDILLKAAGEMQPQPQEKGGEQGGGEGESGSEDGDGDGGGDGGTTGP